MMYCIGSCVLTCVLTRELALVVREFKVKLGDKERPLESSKQGAQ